jgi:hypothetical protein
MRYGDNAQGPMIPLPDCIQRLARCRQIGTSVEVRRSSVHPIHFVLLMKNCRLNLATFRHFYCTLYQINHGTCDCVREPEFPSLKFWRRMLLQGQHLGRAKRLQHAISKPLLKDFAK